MIKDSHNTRNQPYHQDIYKVFYPTIVYMLFSSVHKAFQKIWQNVKPWIASVYFKGQKVKKRLLDKRRILGEEEWKRKRRNKTMKTINVYGIFPKVFITSRYWENKFFKQTFFKKLRWKKITALKTFKSKKGLKSTTKFYNCKN